MGESVRNGGKQEPLLLYVFVVAQFQQIQEVLAAMPDTLQALGAIWCRSRRGPAMRRDADGAGVGVVGGGMLLICFFGVGMGGIP